MWRLASLIALYNAACAATSSNRTTIDTDAYPVDQATPSGECEDHFEAGITAEEQAQRICTGRGFSGYNVSDLAFCEDGEFQVPAQCTGTQNRSAASDFWLVNWDQFPPLDLVDEEGYSIDGNIVRARGIFDRAQNSVESQEAIENVRRSARAETFIAAIQNWSNQPQNNCNIGEVQSFLTREGYSSSATVSPYGFSGHRESISGSFIIGETGQIQILSGFEPSCRVYHGNTVVRHQGPTDLYYAVCELDMTSASEYLRCMRE